MPEITDTFTCNAERTPPTLAQFNGNLDTHKVASQTYRIVNAPADLRRLNDTDLRSLDYACTARWRELDCDALHERVTAELQLRGLRAAFQSPQVAA